MWVPPRHLANSSLIDVHCEMAGGSSAAMSDRLLWIDISRTIALFGMIVFHFVRDLEMFAIIESGMTTQGAWAIFARLVAGAFLFISGVSFVVAHQSGFRPRSWARRILMIGGSAAIVTLATYIAVPDQFIYFGILHAMAAASVIGVVTLSVPTSGLLLLAVFIVVADSLMTSGVFASPILAWTGLSSTHRPSLDFIPLIPWLSAFFAGMAFAKIVPVTRFDVPMTPGRLVNVLAWPGRHSLAIYLLHQPILLAVMWLVLAIA